MPVERTQSQLKGELVSILYSNCELGLFTHCLYEVYKYAKLLWD